jgi:hypothetical protein
VVVDGWEEALADGATLDWIRQRISSDGQI